MSSLLSALELFEEQLRLASPAAADALAPGLAREEIVQRLASVGLGAPDDVLEFFAWHNGSRRRDDRWSSVPIGPGYWLVDLDYMIDQYRERIGYVTHDQGADHLNAGAGWLPIILSDGATMVVGYCQNAPDESVTCTTASADSIIPAPPDLHTLDLATVIDMWRTAIADGTWSCYLTDDGYPVWQTNSDYDTYPLELKLTGLAP